VLLEHADQLQLVTAPDQGKLVEAFLHVEPPEALSQAALEVLAIVAYEQPVSRADISHIRGTDSAGVIDTLLARKLIADDARFGGRGRPAFVVLERPGNAARPELHARAELGRQLTLDHHVRHREAAVRLSARKASRNTRGLSPLRLMTQLEMMTSTLSFGNGICSMCPSGSARCWTSRSRRFLSANRSISSVMSRP
jgi:hypothetical protein